jgi:hypothetical protein
MGLVMAPSRRLRRGGPGDNLRIGTPALTVVAALCQRLPAVSDILSRAAR